MPRARRDRIAKSEPWDLASLKQRAEAVYSERNSLIDEMRALRFMENSPSVPKGMEGEIVRTPLAYQIIERMLGTLTVDKPIIRIPPRDLTVTAEAAASNLEVGIVALLREIERQSDNDPFERFIESLLCDGWGAMRMMHAPQVWAGYPNRAKDEEDKPYNKRVDDWVQNAPIPISWAWCDPKTIYPFWSELGLDHVLEVDQRDPVSLSYGRYNVLNDQYDDIEIDELMREHRDSGAVEFAQLWTQDTLTYWVNGEVVHHTKHNYRRPPYVISRGVSTSVPDTEKSGLSILYPVRKLIPYLDRLLSQNGTAIRMWCWPTPVFRMSDRDYENVKRTIEVRPGQAVTLQPGEDLSFLVWQGNAPDIHRQIEQVSQMIDRATISQVMYGESYAGDSGYLVNQLIAAARMKFRPIVVHAERAHEQLVQLLLDIVENQIGRPLYVYSRGEKKKGWIEIAPDDIQGYRQVQVTVNPLLPTDTYAQTRRVIAEFQSGLRSVRSAMEEIGIDQPDRMVDEIRLDRWLARPEVEEVMAAEVIERYGILQQAKEKQVSAAQMMALFGTMPPALQQAIMGGQLAGAPGAMMDMGQAAPTGTPGIFAAPGVQAVPTTGANTAGLNARPSGVATGRPTGPRMAGEGAP